MISNLNVKIAAKSFAEVPLTVTFKRWHSRSDTLSQVKVEVTSLEHESLLDKNWENSWTLDMITWLKVVMIKKRSQLPNTPKFHLTDVTQDFASGNVKLSLFIK